MASDPHQRSSRYAPATPGRNARASADTPAAKNNPATKNTPAAKNTPARTAAAGRTPSRDTDEFARLMRSNTVDVRATNAPRRRRNPLVGKIAFGLAIVSAAVDASAFAVFMGGDTTFAFGICFVVVFLTLAAAVLGFIAAVGGFGRWYGAIGVVVAFVANPVILIVIVVTVAPELLTEMGG
ncbi:hypothetical protein [Curtobacterium sp. 9128]|uniref:hypothetical protein n=1 Tax=Curtobacterium sp. 9128 TaxID=1793722 RepID=UPI0011A3EEAD|nr:hypothetical protein [Curtobacterium sp. 9128]